MKETHISYATAKALKEFLGDKAPWPMGKDYYDGLAYPAYELCDLLSKEFCEAIGKKLRAEWGYMPKTYGQYFFHAYYDAGLPAVEAELMRMMGK